MNTAKIGEVVHKFDGIHCTIRPLSTHMGGLTPVVLSYLTASLLGS